MKRTVKEVRIMKNIFIAADGTEFEYYEDALYYDFKKLIELGELKCFDCNNKICFDPDSIMTIYIKTERAAECFIELQKYEGFLYKGLKETSREWYFYENDSWIAPKEKIDNLKKEINERIEECGGIS